MLRVPGEKNRHHTFFRYQCAKETCQRVGLLFKFCVSDYTPVGPIDSRRNIQSCALGPNARGPLKKLV
jgi:hypothetical protein